MTSKEPEKITHLASNKLDILTDLKLMLRGETEDMFAKVLEKVSSMSLEEISHLKDNEQSNILHAIPMILDSLVKVRTPQRWAELEESANQLIAHICQKPPENILFEMLTEKNNFSMRAFDTIAVHGQYKIMHTLLEALDRPSQEGDFEQRADKLKSLKEDSVELGKVNFTLVELVLARKGELKLIQELIDRGFTFNKENLLYHAATTRNKDVIDYLFAQPETPAVLANTLHYTTLAKPKDLSIALTTIEHAEPKTLLEEHGGRNALHQVLRSGSEESEKLALIVLEKVAKSFNKSQISDAFNQLSSLDQMPPLHFALSTGKVKAANFLLENGAKLNVVDGKGKSGLDLLKERRDIPQEEKDRPLYLESLYAVTKIGIEQVISQYTKSKKAPLIKNKSRAGKGQVLDSILNCLNEGESQKAFHSLDLILKEPSVIKFAQDSGFKKVIDNITALKNSFQETESRSFESEQQLDNPKKEFQRPQLLNDIDSWVRAKEDVFANISQSLSTMPIEAISEIRDSGDSNLLHIISITLLKLIDKLPPERWAELENSANNLVAQICQKEPQEYLFKMLMERNVKRVRPLDLMAASKGQDRLLKTIVDIVDRPLQEGDFAMREQQLATLKSNTGGDRQADSTIELLTSRKGDVALINELMDRGFSYNKENLLLSAVAYSHKELFDTLFNLPEPPLITANTLYIAVQAPLKDPVAMEIASTIIDKATTNDFLCEYEGKNALHEALRSGCEHIALVILDKISQSLDKSTAHAVFNKYSAREMTPLHYAITNEKYGAAHFLLEQGAVLHALDGKGKSSLDYLNEKLLSPQYHQHDPLHLAHLYIVVKVAIEHVIDDYLSSKKDPLFKNKNHAEKSQVLHSIVNCLKQPERHEAVASVERILHGETLNKLLKDEGFRSLIDDINNLVHSFQNLEHKTSIAPKSEVSIPAPMKQGREDREGIQGHR